MIIRCVNCNKKFEVNASLIPEKGRTIQCGSCNHTWFYNLGSEQYPQSSVKKKHRDQIKEFNIANEKEISIDNENQIKISKVDKLINKTKQDKIKITENSTTDKTLTTNFSFNKILSYFVVIIVSFIALIIILDTFKSPLNDIFPKLELLLYNLFESITDVILFLNDLFI